MAVLAAAQLLDELMGRNRNVLPHEKVKELNWEDPEYCKYFMVKFCPHDLFVNTRADLGVCSKVHDEEVKKLFQQAKGHRKIHYQEEFIRFCSSMVNEVERKILKGKQRLALNSKTDITPANPAQTQRNQEQINMLNERINGLEKEAEQAGNDGNVEQAQGLMKLCDQLKDERDALKKQNENMHWSATAEIAAAQEKQMEVCDVCGAFLIVGDAQQRIEDHLMGKQHVGFAKLKAAIEQIISDVQQARDEISSRNSRGSRTEERRDREREKSKELDKERVEQKKDRESKEADRSQNDNNRDRERDRSEHKLDRDRERSSGERKEKEREKDRDRKERNDRREKEERRDRDKERDRERERERRHRERDRDSGKNFRSSRHSHHRR